MNDFGKLRVFKAKVVNQVKTQPQSLVKTKCVIEWDDILCFRNTVHKAELAFLTPGMAFNWPFPSAPTLCGWEGTEHSVKEQ